MVKHLPRYFVALFVLFILSSSLSLFADTYMVYDEFGGTWHDAEKDWSGDTLMCWAAAASNMLVYTGWYNVDTESFGNTDDVFEYFEAHWTDQLGNQFYGIDWFFDGVNDTQGQGGWAQVDVPGGGFYPGEDLLDYYSYSADDSTAMQNVDDFFGAGQSVSLAIDGPSGHAITAWGYDYDVAATDYYTGIYITDSDANDNSLDYYDISYDSNVDRWYIQDLYGFDTYYITEVHGFDFMPLGAGGSVPEPGTCVLLLIGLSFGWMKYKKYGTKEVEK